MDTPDAPDRPLDASSGEPLHLQLRGHLRAQIVNHSLPPGTSLPYEARPQVRLGASRSVVRQALGTLHARRWIVHLAARAPETPLLITALTPLNAVAPP